MHKWRAAGDGSAMWVHATHIGSPWTHIEVQILEFAWPTLAAVVIWDVDQFMEALSSLKQIK